MFFLALMRYFILFFFTLITAFVKADFSKLSVSYNESIIDSLCEIGFDPAIAYAKKIAVLRVHSSLPFYTEYADKLVLFYDKLLEESVKRSNTEGKFLCYCTLANLSFCMSDRKAAENYLNLAGKDVGQVKDVTGLAIYYRIKAQYLQRYIPDKLLEALNNYQISLSFYEKSGVKGKEDEIALIYRNFSIDAFMRNDSTYVAKSVRKLNELSESHHSPIVAFYYYDVKSTLCNLHYQFTADERFIDSTVYYLKKCLEIHDNGLLPKSFDVLCVDLYAIVAEMMSMKNNPDVIVIDSLLAIVIDTHLDSIGMARVFQTKARTFLKRNQIDLAEAMALKSQSFLLTGYNNHDYLIEKRNIDLLRHIYKTKGDYKQVIEYNNLWDNKIEEIRANEVKKLELQFEAEMKESELKRLYAEGVYQENRFKLFILACALLCLTSLFLIFFLQFKKRNLNSQIALIDAEREETKLKVKLKEEQTVKMQLEKYMALSDFRLTELELIGKTQELEQLYKDKEELDKQVELFRHKVEAYEVSIGLEEQEGSDKQSVIMEDLKRLFSRQSDTKYAENLEMLNKSFIDHIIEKCNGSLSVSYLKYIVCFAIGMGTNEVADIFNIEQSSVHMIRYRLKKKFRLSNDDDLSQFLQTI